MLVEVNRLHDHSTRIVEENTTAFRELSETLTMEDSTQSMLRYVMKKIDKMDIEMSVLLASIPTSTPQSDDDVIVEDNVQAQEDKNNWRVIGHKRVWRASWEQIKEKKKSQRRVRRRRNRMRKHDVPIQDPKTTRYSSQSGSSQLNSNNQDRDWTHQMLPVVMKGIRNYMQKYNHNRVHEKYDNFVRGGTILNGHEYAGDTGNHNRSPQRQQDTSHNYRQNYDSHTCKQHHPPNRQHHDRRQYNHDRRQYDQGQQLNYQFQQRSSPFLGFQR